MGVYLNTTDTNRLLLPEPTLKDPLSQVDFLFKRLAKIRSTSRHNFLTALSLYKKLYLAATNNYDPNLPTKKLFYIHEQWDSFCLLKVQSFLENNNTESNPLRLSSASVANFISALRQVMQYAALHKLTTSTYIYSTSSAPVQRETNQNEAYSDAEMDIINNWLKEKLTQANKIICTPGYQRVGGGQDPRIRKPRTLQHQQSKSGDFGWTHIANQRWYFENVMDCQAEYKRVTPEHPHYSFYYHTANHPGGYQSLFIDWRIKPIITLDVMMPLALKLSLESGLNPSSLWNLTTDCFQEKHPLTGVPYIQYYKARSQGHMEMHLSPYNKDATICEFKEQQANVIRKTIALVLQATSSLRASAPKGSENILFLFQVSRKNYFGEVRRMHDGVSSTWCTSQVATYGLKAENGRPLQLALGRFRSTRITDMVRKGFDFFEIQSQCGHRSILTTLKYIARNNLEVKARQDVLQALRVIHDNQAWQQQTQPAYAGTPSSSHNTILYKGIVADCRNVYDPPDEVKKLKEYTAGQACTRFNMCLFCKNVVLMRHHLPMLVNYQRQIREAIGHNTTELPNEQYYVRTLGILDRVLDPSTSEFSQDDITWANTAAETMDGFIDPVVYRSIL
ncbi:hypothetical protein GCM10027346_37500 [Hymenobacter seoulensis]